MKRHISTFNRFSLNESQYDDLAVEIYEELFAAMRSDNTGKVIAFFDAADEWAEVENRIISEIKNSLEIGEFSKYVSPDGDVNMRGIMREIGIRQRRGMID